MGAALLPERQAVQLHPRADRRAGGAQPGRHRRRRGGVHQRAATERLRQTRGVTHRSRSSGFAITYVIDDANGQAYTKLRLSPRLLAKLLTESYPAALPIKQEYAALSNNPLNITLDPEFIKLNPGIAQGVSASDAASTLLALSSDSDVIRALTTYINDDPAARAWLNGKPDPWGMVVNPAYKHIDAAGRQVAAAVQRSSRRPTTPRT